MMPQVSPKCFATGPENAENAEDAEAQRVDGIVHIWLRPRRALSLCGSNNASKTQP